MRELAAATDVDRDLLERWAAVLAVAELRPYDLTHTPRMAEYLAAGGAEHLGFSPRQGDDLVAATMQITRSI